MKKDRTPVHAKGYRNVFCPHYRSCLDHASEKYWNYWQAQIRITRFRRPLTGS